jgi:DNA polymerase III sliding clamp (beta) subunit (PCNA family)
VIDGTFPDYARFIPEGGHRLTVDPAVIAKSLKRLDGVRQDRFNPVKLDATDNTLTMHAHTITAGILSESWAGGVGVNVRYLLGAVTTMIARAPGHLILELGKPGDPMRLSCAAVPDAFHVLMPMRY